MGKVTTTGPVVSRYAKVVARLADKGFSASAVLSQIVTSEATVAAAGAASAFLTANGIDAAQYVAMTYAPKGTWVTSGPPKLTDEERVARDAVREALSVGLDASTPKGKRTLDKRVQRMTAIGLLSLRFGDKSYSALAAKFDAGATGAAESFRSGEWSDAVRKPSTARTPKATPKAKTTAGDGGEGGYVGAVDTPAITKAAQGATTGSVLSALDALLANLDGRTLVQSERQRYAEILRSHGLTVAPKATPKAA